jgi:hypothetical protein
MDRTHALFFAEFGMSVGGLARAGVFFASDTDAPFSQRDPCIDDDKNLREQPIGLPEPSIDRTLGTVLNRMSSYNRFNQYTMHQAGLGLIQPKRRCDPQLDC